MKKSILFQRLKVIPLTGLVLTILLFSACKKSVDSGIQTPVAGLMAFNLAPDKAIGVAISGSNLTNSPILYPNYNGGYQQIYVGNRDLTSYEYSTGIGLATANQVFEDSSYYSVFVVGANGKYRNSIVKDNLNSLPSTTGQAFVRYVNAIADTTRQPMVTISSNGTDVFNDNAAFATVSDFKGITPGNVSVAVNSESVINSTRTITLEQGKVYTVLLMGIPQATDTTKAVQIRFIQNGTISPNP